MMTSPILQKFGIDNFKGEVKRYNYNYFSFKPISISWKSAIFYFRKEKNKMANEKQIDSRIQHKHDIAANWYIAGTATNPFIPKISELIIYDPDSDCDYARIKIGNGINNVNDLPFITDTLQFIVDNALNTSDKTIVGAINELNSTMATYILNIDYKNLLAFDTSEIIFGGSSTTSVLGQAILGQMVLA